MTKFGFNNMTLSEKHDFLFINRGDNYVKFISYRKEVDLAVSLWDCGDFFAEVYATKKNKYPVKIEAIDLYDSRIDLYIDFATLANDQVH